MSARNVASVRLESIRAHKTKPTPGKRGRFTESGGCQARGDCTPPRPAERVRGAIVSGAEAAGFVNPEALAIVHASLHDQFLECARERDIFGMLCCTDNHRNVDLALALAPACSLLERSRLLADAYQMGSGGERIRGLIQECSESGFPLFDCDEAAQAFKVLPPLVTLYRGGLGVEGRKRPFGLSWSLSRSVAESFAMQDRFKRWSEEGEWLGWEERPGRALFKVRVRREHLAGLLLERKEQEVLVARDLRFHWPLVSVLRRYRRRGKVAA